MDHAFEWVTARDELRGIVGEPLARIRDKARDHLDADSIAFVARSSFVLVASGDAEGSMDVSPKGDPPGFVHVLDERTLAIPDRPGNRRADTFENVLVCPSVALLFLVPGRGETLRVNGEARISRAEWLRSRMAIEAKVPELVLVVRVREAFMHCPKCAMRSGIWEPARWPGDIDACRRIPVRSPLY